MDESVKAQRLHELRKEMAELDERRRDTYDAIHELEVVEANAKTSGVKEDGTPFIELSLEATTLRWEFLPGESIAMAARMVEIAQGTAEWDEYQRAMAEGTIDEIEIALDCPGEVRP